jgi:hypothetical protein
MELKSVSAFSDARYPNRANGVAALIGILCRGEVQKGTQDRVLNTSVLPKQDQKLLDGTSLAIFEPHYRRPNLTLRRAHVTRRRNSPVENQEEIFRLFNLQGK